MSEVGKIVVKVDLDGTGFQNGVSNLNRQMKIVQTEFQAASAKLGGFGKSTDALKLKADSLTKQMDLQKQKVAALQQAYEQSAATKGKDAKATQDLEIKLNKAKAQLAGMGNQLQQLNAQIQQQSSVWTKLSQAVGAVSDRVKAAGEKMASVGRTLSTSVTTPIIGIGTAAVATVSKFDDGMSKVQAITGATAEDMGKLRQQAKDLGRDTRFSASQVADAYNYMGMAGWDANKMLAATPGLLNLAAAGAVDLGRASDIVTDTMSQFNLTAEQAGHVADVFAVAQASANLNVEMLGETMKYAGPVAASFGASLEETSAVAMIFANNAIKGSEAGTALRAGLSRLAAPPSEAAKALKTLKVETTDTHGNMLPLEKIVAQLSEKFKGLSESQQLANAKAIFGQEAMSAWIKVIEAGPEELKKFTKALQESDGASDKMAKTMEDNIGGSFRSLKSAIEIAAIEIGERLAPTIRKIADFITELTRQFTQLNPAIQNMVIAFGLIAAAIGPVLFIIGQLVMSVGAIGSVFASASGAIASAGGIMAVITGPVGIAIAAITGLVAVGVLLYKNWDTIKAKTAEVWSGIQPIISQAMGAISSFVNAKLQEIKSFWDQNGTQIVQAATNIWNTIKNVISTVMTALSPIISVTWTGIQMIVQSVWENIKGVISGALNVIQGLIKVFAGVFTGDWSKAWEGIKQATSGAVEFLWNAIQLTLFGKVLGAAKVFITGFKAVFTAGWTAIKSVFTGSISAVQNVVTTGFNAIRSVSNAIMNGLRTLISSVWNGIRTTITSVVNTVKTNVTTGFNSLKTSVTTAMNNVKTTITTIWDTIMAFFKGIDLTKVGSDIIGGLIKGIMGKAGELYEKAKGIANNIETTIRKALDTHSPSRKMQKVGHDVGDGLKKGLKDKEKEVKKSSKTLGEKVLEGMKAATDQLQSKLDGLKAQFELGLVVNQDKTQIEQLKSELNNLNQQFKVQEEIVNKTRAAYVKLSNDKKTLPKEAAEAARKYAEEAKTLKELSVQISDVQFKLAANTDETARAREEIELLNAEHERELANLDEEAGKLAELELKRKQVGESIEAQKHLVAQLNREYNAARDAKNADGEATRKAYMEYIKAQTEQAKLEKELRNTNKAIIEQKKELEAANKKTQKETDKTNEKLREQQEAIQDTVKKVGELASKYRDDLAKAHEEYQRKVTDTNRKLLDDERKVTEQFENELASRAKSLRDFVGLFDAVQPKEVSGQQLLDNLKGQVETFEDWQKNIGELTSRGIDEGLLKELRDMGPKAAGEIAALNTLSDAELSQYVSLWREKNQLAKNEATVQLEETKQEMYNKMAELRAQAAQQLQQYADEWQKKNEEITKNTTEELKKMVDEAGKKGEEMIASLALAITKSLPQLASAFRGIPIFDALFGDGEAGGAAVDGAKQQADGVIGETARQKTGVIDNTNQMTQAVNQAWAQASQQMAQQHEQIRTQTLTTWQNIEQQLLTLWNKMLADLKKTWTEKQKFLFEVLKQVETRFNGLVNAANNWGLNLMNNFISAVQSQFGRLHEVMFNMTQIVDSYMPHSPAKVGPLSTLDEWGPGMIGAFVDGIQASVPDLQRVMNQVATVSTLAQPSGGFALSGGAASATTNHYGGNTIQIMLPSGSVSDQADALLRELRKRGVRL